MFAPTSTYGGFAGRVNHHGPQSPSKRVGDAAEIPKTSPLLLQFFETTTGSALEEVPYAGFVDNLAQCLVSCLLTLWITPRRRLNTSTKKTVARASRPWLGMGRMPMLRRAALRANPSSASRPWLGMGKMPMLRRAALRANPSSASRPWLGMGRMSMLRSVAASELDRLRTGQKGRSVTDGRTAMQSSFWAAGTKVFVEREIGLW